MVFCLTFDYKTVGGRIKHYRLSINKTQEELAELADISANHLSALENGRSAGSLDKYYSVAQALGVTVDMLIDKHLIVHPETTTSFQTNFYRLFLHFPLSNVKC